MNKLILSTVFWLVVGAPLWADPSSSAKGIILLTSASGLDPRNVLFSDLVWTDFYGGDVIDSDGQKSVFAKKDIGKIVYFDFHYYSQLDNDQQMKAFREGIQAREVVVNTFFLNLDANNDMKSLQDNESSFESLVQMYPAIQPLVQPQINLLKDDIDKLSSGQSLLNGKWMTQEEANAQAPPAIGGGAQTCTFTTKDGKKYVNAKVTVTDTGISILTSDGGTTIPFDQLPDDLSIFPSTVSSKIKQLKDNAAKAADEERLNTQPSNSDATTSKDQGVSNAKYANIWNIYIDTPFPKTVIEEGLSTEETIKYINDKIASRGYIITYNPHIKKFLLGLFQRSRNSAENSSSLAGTFTPRMLEPLIEFNPGDLNPDEIQEIRTPPDPRGGLWDMFREPYQLQFTTTNKNDSLSSIPPTIGAFHTFRIPIEIEDDMQHVGNAFNHLIKLYGGRSDSDISNIEDANQGVKEIVSDLPMPVEGDQKTVMKLIEFINIKLKDSRWHLIYDDKQKAFAFTYDTLGGKNELLFMPSDIILDSVKVAERNDGFFVQARTVTGKYTHALLGSRKGEAINLDIPAREDADALCTALTQLIQMYGGKPEEF